MGLELDRSDASTLPIAGVVARVGSRVRAHRLEHNRTQGDVATEAGVSKRTVERLEAGDSVQLDSFLRILRALGLLGNLDTLLPAPIKSPLSQVDLGERPRRRASPRSDTPPDPSGWTWGDER